MACVRRIVSPLGSGQVPAAAARRHAAQIEAVAEEALAEAGLSAGELSGVACTIGPGLGPCLDVGLGFAGQLAAAEAVPFLPVHHMEAHLLTARLVDRQSSEFPFLVLLTSGGHCLLLLAEALGRYRRLGTTLDDAPGEALDKVARMLGIDGGGRGLEEVAADGDPGAVSFPLPLRSQRSCDFSFSGLKAAARREVLRRCGIDDRGSREGGTAAEWQHTAELMQADAMRQHRANIAASFQSAALTHIAVRTHRAILFARQWLAGEREAAGTSGRALGSLGSLTISGGVACNRVLRGGIGALAGRYDMDVVCPPISLCVDNGAMIAWTGLEYLEAHAQGCIGGGGEAGAAVLPSADGVRYRPKWPLGTDWSGRLVEARIHVRASDCQL